MNNSIEDWGTSYSGGVLSWKDGNDDNKTHHGWDINPKNPRQF